MVSSHDSPSHKPTTSSSSTNSSTSPAGPDRLSLILAALAPCDSTLLRTYAAQEGGLLNDELRRRVWPVFLNVSSALTPLEQLPEDVISPSSSTLPHDSSSPPTTPTRTSPPPLVSPLPFLGSPIESAPSSLPISLTTNNDFTRSASVPSTTASLSSPFSPSPRPSPSPSPSPSSVSTPLPSDLSSSFSSSTYSYDSSLSPSSYEFTRHDETDDTMSHTTMSFASEQGEGEGESKAADGEQDGSMGASFADLVSSTTSLGPHPRKDSPLPTPTAKRRASLPIPQSPPLRPDASLSDRPPTPFTCFVSPPASPSAPLSHSKDLAPFRHPDESQIHLDTNRAFVTYPLSLRPSERDDLKRALDDLIVGFFRGRGRGFGYFQGYHDVASVLLLTFFPIEALVRTPRSRYPSTSFPNPPSSPPPASLSDEEIKTRADTCMACLERLSCFRLRDGMGQGLEPIMGYLRLLKRLLHSLDPLLAKLISQTSPLPFFALSHLLTLFSHDVDSLETIQLVFDFLLGRNPAMVIYLEAAIIESKRSLLLSLAPTLSSDPGILHSLLSKLPPIIPSSSPSASPAPASTPTPPPTADDDNGDYQIPPQASLSLPTVFARTLEIWEAFPLDGEGGVKAREIMGEKSVLFTSDEALSERSSQEEKEGRRGTAEKGELEWEWEEARKIVNHPPSMINVHFVDDEDNEDLDELDDLLDGGGEKDSSFTSTSFPRPPSSAASREKEKRKTKWVQVLSVVVAIGAVGVAISYSQSSASSRGGRSGGLGGAVRDWGRTLMREGGVGLGMVREIFGYGGRG